MGTEVNDYKEEIDQYFSDSSEEEEEEYTENPSEMSYEGKRNEKGEYHGIGKLLFSNGDTYTGNFLNNKRNGIGYLKKKNGNVLDGYFKDDEFHGQGKLFLEFLTEKGDISSVLLYDGNWIEGKKEGKGIAFYPNGSIKYHGIWKAGKMNGEGTLYDALENDERRITGKFKSDDISFGKIKYGSGKEYKGEIKNYLPNGKGEMNIFFI